jgi:hypothetical protein
MPQQQQHKRQTASTAVATGATSPSGDGDVAQQSNMKL